MRLFRVFATLAAFTLALIAPARATAQAALPCTGNLAAIRVSEIKPGMMPKFLQAVNAQRAWYKATGAPDQITAMRILERSGNSATVSETQAMTMHIEPANRQHPIPHDAGYAAFVALFKESSTIKSEFYTCMVQ